ncbi:LysR family transcriptional regulator [Metapseudomonas resinovorans]|uniref:LysR substrate-binding domain-containing protein n=1 Tax=Metapseudomonas resinovorans TaxID=53412 RepID=UPI0009870631|nr:LysR substrate-binding domain-containing protein [Pseudomonas resinovorans]GLZ87166.1 LysR family transcriptional regulator [Pseudomonas resinovorans]
MRLPSLIALRTFEVAARSRNFTEAAQELSVTPGAVSRQIRLLESELGVTLFDRTRNTVTLNDNGHRLAATVTQAFELLTRGADELRGQDEGPIHITCAPSIASHWLMRRLNQFAASNPDITLSLEATEQLVDLERGEATLAIRFTTTETPMPASELLFLEEFFPVCSPTYLEQFGPIREPRDMLGARLIHTHWKNTANLHLPSWEDWFATFVGEPGPVRGGMRFGLIGHAIQGAVSGQGFALGSTALACDDIANGRLVLPFGEGCRLPTPWAYRLAWSRRSPPPEKVRRLIDWLLAEARASTVPDQG